VHDPALEAAWLDSSWWRWLGVGVGGLIVISGSLSICAAARG
jgi:hypothetical protein